MKSFTSFLVSNRLGNISFRSQNTIVSLFKSGISNRLDLTNSEFLKRDELFLIQRYSNTSFLDESQWVRSQLGGLSPNRSCIVLTKTFQHTLTRAMSGNSGIKKGPKQRKVFVCSDCGESYPQWWGFCKNCGQENTLAQFFVEKEVSGASGGGGGPATRALERVSANPEKSVRVQGNRGGWVQGTQGGPQRLKEVLKGKAEGPWRLPLKGDGGKELSRVLGGGIVPGSLILVGGDPGVGKSTLLLQVAGLLSEGNEEFEAAPVLYISGEESVEQVSNRAERMSISAEELYLYSATDMDLILEWMQKLAPRAVVVDSIQTVFLSEATGSAGSTSQVRECATALLHAAKRTGIAVFLVGHVTKSGDIAGPRVLEHIVDVVLYMEGERLQSHRLIRGVKNRYGATDEVGVFEMTESGLMAVENPSMLFLSERSSGSVEGRSGAASSVAVLMQGTRPIMMEVQALCSATQTPPGRRMTNGVDFQRMPLIFAVLAKQVNINTFKHDVFVNVVGGAQLKETGADLAIAMAITSSVLEVPIPTDFAFVGEIGLHGELRSVGQVERRLSEASKMGFKRCIVPATPHSAKKTREHQREKKIETIECKTLGEAILAALSIDVSTRRRAV